MAKLTRRQMIQAGATVAAIQLISEMTPANAFERFTAEDTLPNTWTMTAQAPSQILVPAVLGASGTINSPLGASGFDYFSWFGITHNRYWFDATFSPLNPTGGVTDESGFQAGITAIRANPQRQGTSTDVYIDWANLYQQFDVNQQLIFAKFQAANIIPLMINTTLTSDNPLTNWGDKFMYWKLWYAYVFYFASTYDVTMYEFANEPVAVDSFTKWESHWLVCANAMRSAITDVNKYFSKSLRLFICGPTCPGAWWDETLPDPAANPHGWGSVSWNDVQTTYDGNFDPAIWNYGMYDYHSYEASPTTQQSIITSLRKDIAAAPDSPSSTIPLIITEYNTATGATYTRLNLDTEDIQYGIGIAQILQATTTLGSAGLGDQGGLLLFKLGEASSTPTLKNSTTYVSEQGSNNYGGVTRGGICFQLYARHFRGGKPTLGIQTTNGSSDARSAVAVFDAASKAYYVYISNLSGVSATTTLDISSLDVRVSAPYTIARVDVNNTGQITELLHIPSSMQLSFQVPDGCAMLIWIPQSVSAANAVVQLPTCDTYLVLDDTITHSDQTMKVSLHHSTANLRRIAFLQFDLTSLSGGARYLLRLTGHNIGTDITEREILHVYGAGSNEWSVANLTWSTAPGVGAYYTSATDLTRSDGLGGMVDIEDNYAGLTDGHGHGLGIHGSFLGPISFNTGDWTTNYVDVSDYVRSLIVSGESRVTFVIARIVRYNVNDYSGAPYYNQGVYDYDGRIVEIGAMENTDVDLRPALVVWKS